MPIVTVSDLVQVLNRHPLLDAHQMAELTHTLFGQFTEPRALSKELLERGWLTPYQVNQLLQEAKPQLVLGPYVLLELISEGPMGDVFKARHQHMKRTVSLQIIRADLLKNADAVERFYTEVQTASLLSHPNIVASYDAGPVGATHFFAMEYIEGIDLERLVGQQGPLPVRLACDLTRQAGLGLQHAFERHSRHHDLKPANLLVSGLDSQRVANKKDSRVPGAGPVLKIRNLGLTVIRQPTKHTRLDLNASRDGTAFSTADYIAPERAATGELCDIRAELYSLGCSLYFLLTGQVPFPGGTVADKYRWHQEEEPAPIESLRSNVPPEVAAVMHRLMAKHPDERFQTPAEAANALAALHLPKETASATQLVGAAWRRRKETEKKRWRQRVLAGGVALGVGLLFFTSLLLWQGRRPTTTAASAPSSEPDKPLLGARPGLLVHCGKGEDIVVPGFGWRRLQGDSFNGWTPPAAKTHVWVHPQAVRFDVLVPPGVGGILKMHFIDAHSDGRKQKVFVQGKLIETLDSFKGPGRKIDVLFAPGEPKDGKINVVVENMPGSPNSVISTFEFVPYVKSGLPDPTVPLLTIQCGKGKGAKEAERVGNGYGYKVNQAELHDEWPPPATKTHCWVHPQEIRFDVFVPKDSRGMMRLHFVDGSAESRRQKLIVQGKEIGQYENFGGDGRRVDVLLTPAETRTGKIEVAIQNLKGDSNVVVSSVEIFP